MTAAFAGSCGLRILPLGQVSLPRTTLDVPADPQAHAFTTTALEYEAAREGDFSAFLVTTETEGARASRVEKTDSGWLIRSEAFELSLERKTALQWVAIDERTGTQPGIRSTSVLAGVGDAAPVFTIHGAEGGLRPSGRDGKTPCSRRLPDCPIVGQALPPAACCCFPRQATTRERMQGTMGNAP